MVCSILLDIYIYSFLHYVFPETNAFTTDTVEILIQILGDRVGLQRQPHNPFFLPITSFFPFYKLIKTLINTE